MSPNKMDCRSLLKADAIGRVRDLSHLPFAGPLWNRMLSLCNDSQAKSTRKIKRNDLYKLHSDVAYLPNDNTYAAIERISGLTKMQECEYKSLLKKVTSFPCVVNYAPLHSAIQRDGCQDDITSVCSLTPTNTCENCGNEFSANTCPSCAPQHTVQEVFSTQAGYDIELPHNDQIPLPVPKFVDVEMKT
jgi:hypothetical protein